MNSSLRQPRRSQVAEELEEVKATDHGEGSVDDHGHGECSYVSGCTRLLEPEERRTLVGRESSDFNIYLCSSYS